MFSIKQKNTQEVVTAFSGLLELSRRHKVQTSNNIVIIPISKVSFGFAAGGSEFKGETIDEYKKADKEEAIQYRLPFGGGSRSRCYY